MTSGPVQKLECTMPSREDILNLPIDKRDAHTNPARWRERAYQDRCYRTIRDALGVPYGIEHNPEMPPLSTDPEVILFGGRRGAGKSNELAWWSSYYRVRGYDSITNMSLLNAYVLGDSTDVYALGYLWNNTPCMLDEFQMVSSTFEGPAHKTRMLLDFYSQIRKMNIPIYMTSAQPHRIYSAIDTELTWYAKPMKAHYRHKYSPKMFPGWAHTYVKYYGPFPVRYPDIAEKIFDDHEDEELLGRWVHNSTNGHTAESIWRASKVSFSWETMTPGQLLSVNADSMREKVSNRQTAMLIVDDEARQGRQDIIIQLLNMIKYNYLSPGQERWEWSHVCQQMHSFHKNRPMDRDVDNFKYVTPTESELKMALEMEANISPRRASLVLKDLVDRYPQVFESRAIQMNDYDEDEDERQGFF